VSLPWLRLYTEFASDPKIQILAFEDQRHYVMLLCLQGNGILDASSVNENYRERLIAKALGLDPASAAEVKRRLMEGGLICETWHPSAWNKRQMKSDHDSGERTERYRANRAANGLPRISKVNEKYWDVIFARDGGKCVYCSSTTQLLLDHMQPISQGGTDDPDNLALACKKCNCGKAGRTPEEAGLAISDSARLALTRYRDTGDTRRHVLEGERDSEEIRKDISPLREAEIFDYMKSIREAYPKPNGREDWITAEKGARTLVLNGEASWLDLYGGVQRYSLHVGETGSYAMNPAKFFTAIDRPWSQAWEIPEKKPRPRKTKFAQAMEALERA
jgi:5-methylcytosine-specific restriction endonuclease McrA